MLPHVLAYDISNRMWVLDVMIHRYGYCIKADHFYNIDIYIYITVDYTQT